MSRRDPWTWEKEMADVLGFSPADPIRQSLEPTPTLEQLARRLVKQGLQWMADTKPVSPPQIEGLRTVHGPMEETDSAGAALRAAMLEGIQGDVPPALFCRAAETVYWIRLHGWEPYRQLMKRAKRGRFQ